jgi:hypothetical protein
VKQAMTEKQVVQMDDAGLAQTVEGLRQLPRKSRPLREVIAYLQAEIRQTLAKGYSYKEMVAFLAEQGIAIAEPTLRQYMSNANPAKRAKAPATQEKTSKVRESYTPDISKKGDSDAGNISSQQSSEARTISNQQSSDTQPTRTVGRFVEMPDEL